MSAADGPAASGAAHGAGEVVGESSVAAGGAGDPPVEVRVMVRDGCHLCEDALRALEALRAREPFAVVPVDIEADDALHRRYLERIPVPVVAGEELGDFFVDGPRVLAAVRAARAAASAA